MNSSLTLLQNAIILDSETTGLTRGSGIHELAVFDLETMKTYEWILNPNLVRVKGLDKQDTSKLASTQGDRFQSLEQSYWSWKTVAKRQLEMELGRKVTPREFSELLIKKNEMLWDSFYGEQPYPHLVGKTETPDQMELRRKMIREKGGSDLVRMPDRMIQNVLGKDGDFEKLIRGKTIWIANAAFESKQIGAQLGAMDAAGIANAIKDSMETSNPNSPDPFYVTGREINAAKVEAQLTGDWTGVWKSYLANTPKAGETAVRDIQDVTRAMLSYGKKLGMIDTKDVYFGQSIDTQYRLLGSLEGGEKGKSFLRSKELHRAAEDSTVHEQYVLRKAVHYTSALQAVEEGTEYGRELTELAKQGKGALHEANLYFARMKHMGGHLKRAAVAQRFGRALEDLEKDAVTYQVSGVEKIIAPNQVTPSGEAVPVPRTIPHRVPFQGMDELASHLETQSSYGEFGVDVKAEYDRFMGAAKGSAAEAQNFVAMERSQVAKAFDREADALMGLTPSLGRVGGHIGRESASSLVEAAIGAINIPKGVGGFLGLAAGLGAMGMLAWDTRRAGEPESRPLTSYGYQDWLDRQGEFYGQAPQHNGMQESGVGGATRKQNTDFGSPYQGPMTSSMVLADQELLRERENYLRQKYGAEHYDPMRGIFGIFGPFKLFKSNSKSYLPGGEAYEGAGQGLKGNLLAISLSDGTWKATADDADTIVVKRAGVRGAVADFFGMNAGYSFRLAGIDSPETSHGEGSYHAPQPRAEESKEVFQAMLANSKDLTLVFDPGQTTYGRMMGAVIGDGKNLNFELVKTGAAAHLGYGKREDSMIDYGAMERMEDLAFKSGKGIWQTPWARVFHEVTAQAEDRITFNTFTKTKKLVENASTMGTLGLMEHAQATGMVTTAHLTEAAQLGQHLKDTRFAADYKSPNIFMTSNHPHNAYADEVMIDAANFMRTKGTGQNPNKFQRDNGYGRLDSQLTLDTMGHNMSPMTRRRPQALEMYGAKAQASREKKARQADAQRRLNQTVFNSGIGHHQM